MAIAPCDIHGCLPCRISVRCVLWLQVLREQGTDFAPTITGCKVKNRVALPVCAPRVSACCQQALRNLNVAVGCRVGQRAHAPLDVCSVHRRVLGTCEGGGHCCDEACTGGLVQGHPCSCPSLFGHTAHPLTQPLEEGLVVVVPHDCLDASCLDLGNHWPQHRVLRGNCQAPPELLRVPFVVLVKCSIHGPHRANGLEHDLLQGDKKQGAAKPQGRRS
mmetsp:Transcript_45431/g.144846  ORF Transcript_45431/g.144846 Transcript_45431/m.144846 type:complete len:218 (-) Transcript_45431:270-923(-)